jgi:hypothetical protein
MDFGHGLLLALKIIGILGAFLGLSSHLGESSGSTGEPKKSNKRLIIALVFLLVAVGAEICEAEIKQLEQSEDAQKAQRILFPLGTLTVTTEFTIDLTGVPEYNERLLKLGSGIYEPKVHLKESDPRLPQGESEAGARNLLMAHLEPMVFFYSQPVTKSFWARFMSRSRTEQADGAVMSFSLTDKSKMTTPSGYNFGEGEFYTTYDSSKPDSIVRRYFRFEPMLKRVKVSDGSYTVTPDERFVANDEIVSIYDLAGKKMEVNVCPVSEKEVLRQTIKLSSFVLQFAGKKSLSIGDDFSNKFQITPPVFPDDKCMDYEFAFPADKSKFLQLLK